MKIALLFVFAMTPSFATAFELMPVLGYQENRPTVNVSNTTSPKGSGFRVGAIVGLGLIPTLSLRTGLIWNQRDFSADVDLSALTTPPRSAIAKTKLTYIDIPLNLKFDLPLTNLYLFGGFIYAVKTGDSIEYDPSLESIGVVVTRRATFASSDTMMNLGIGYAPIQLPAAKVAFELEYDHGLSNIYSMEGTSDSVFNRSYILSITAGFSF